MDDQHRRPSELGGFEGEHSSGELRSPWREEQELRRRERRGCARDYGEGEFSGSPYAGGRNIDPYGRRPERGRSAQADYPEPSATEWERRAREDRGLQGHYGESNRFFGFRGGEPGPERPGLFRRAVRAFRAPPKGYVRSDERIREDVCDRLLQQNEVDPSDVEVTVSRGEVTLTGSVQTRRDKVCVEQLVDSVSGVEDVHNRLRLRRRSHDVSDAAQPEVRSGGPAPFGRR